MYAGTAIFYRIKPILVTCGWFKNITVQYVWISDIFETGVAKQEASARFFMQKTGAFFLRSDLIKPMETGLTDQEFLVSKQGQHLVGLSPGIAFATDEAAYLKGNDLGRFVSGLGEGGIVI